MYPNGAVLISNRGCVWDSLITCAQTESMTESMASWQGGGWRGTRFQNSVPNTAHYRRILISSPLFLFLSQSLSLTFLLSLPSFQSIWDPLPEWAHDVLHDSYFFICLLFLHTHTRASTHLYILTHTYTYSTSICSPSESCVQATKKGPGWKVFFRQICLTLSYFLCSEPSVMCVTPWVPWVPLSLPHCSPQ